MFFMPLNAAINPYLYTFSTKPFRIPIDDLLANWVDTGEEEEELEDDEEGREETEIGDSTTETVPTKKGKRHHTPAQIAAAREAAIKDIL